MIYTMFTDAELLQEIDDRRRHSPIIDELAKRLALAEKPVNCSAQCPVCDAALTVDYDDTFELSV